LKGGGTERRILGMEKREWELKLLLKIIVNLNELNNQLTTFSWPN
jgi:hypothetical protein